MSAFLTLLEANSLTADNVERIVVKLPEDGARIVNNRAMPDVNCQHIIAVALLDGGLSFESSHSHQRMHDPRVLRVKERVQLIADPSLMDPAAPRSGLVQVMLKDGRTLELFVPHAPGAKENPMSEAGVNEKARSLIEPVLGAQRTVELIERVNRIEREADVRAIASLLGGR